MLSGPLGLLPYTAIIDKQRPTIKVNGRDVPLTLYHFGQNEDGRTILNASKETLNIDSMTDLHDTFFSEENASH